MPKKSFKAEVIINQLREAEALTSHTITVSCREGQTIPSAIRVLRSREQPYY